MEPKTEAIKNKIEDLLENEVRPMLHSHGGDVRLCGYEDGEVWLELSGACSGCPSADFSTKIFIEEVLRAAVPEVERLQLTQEVDPEMLDFFQKIVNKSHETIT